MKLWNFSLSALLCGPATLFSSSCGYVGAKSIRKGVVDPPEDNINEQKLSTPTLEMVPGIATEKEDRAANLSRHRHQQRNLVISSLDQTNFALRNSLGKSFRVTTNEPWIAIGDDDGSNVYKWVFENYSGDYYVIRNVFDQKVVYLGDAETAYGKTSSEMMSYEPDRARWMVMGVTDRDRYFWFQNKRWPSLYLYVTGDMLKVTNNPNDSSCWWSLLNAENVGVGQGTSFNIVAETVMSVEYMDGNTISTKPDIVDKDTVVNKSPTETVTKPVHFSKNYLTSSTMTVSTTQTNAFMQSIRILVGSALLGLEVETTTETSYEKSVTNENSVTSETVTNVQSEAEIVCPPKTRCEMIFKMTIETRNIPWLATVVRTYGDGSYAKEYVRGTWQGVLYTNKYTEFKTIPAYDYVKTPNIDICPDGLSITSAEECRNAAIHVGALTEGFQADAFSHTPCGCFITPSNIIKFDTNGKVCALNANYVSVCREP